ncbi:uncharacterized protein LOC135843579 [Planococcus citri]|uniref:uncharacterized protein LOC135843579 n=1 Tax=Planococcus citri TaxID=170843 RepID=UPI0031FA0842
MADSQLDGSPAIGTVTDEHSSGDSSNTNPNDEESWQNFKIIKSTHKNDNEHEYNVSLKDSQISIIGDTWVRTEKGDSYFLDRVIIVSKSNLLERYSQDFDKLIFEDIIASTVKETDMFAPIFQIMYGKDLKNVISESNFVDLLMNMYDLEMEIDFDVFKQFIEETIKPKKEVCSKMFKLYSFMLNCRVFDESFDYLLPTVSRYFSDRLLEACKMKAFSSVPYEGIFLILSHRNEDESQNEAESKIIGRICAEWICHEFKKRIDKLIKLVNATKHRYGIFHYCSTDEKGSIVSSLKQIDKSLRVQKVEECFNELLYYDGEITFDSSKLTDDVVPHESRIRIINVIDQPRRWAMLLEKGRFCDVIIDVQGFPYKLHRIKLLLSSPFFYDLFTKDNESPDSTIDGKSESDEIPMETYTLDEVDAEAFEKIIRYIYEGEIEITSGYLMINLLKASKFLQMDDLYEKCYSWFLNSGHKIPSIIFDLFEFLCENDVNSKLYKLVTLRIHAVWPKYDVTAFKRISLKALKEIVALPKLSMNTSDEVIDQCSEWIFHDIEKRYSLMYEIAKSINRNFAMKMKPLKLISPENSVEYSVKWVKEQLLAILKSTALVFVPLKYDSGLKNEQRPRFIGTRTDGSLCIMDEYFSEIVSISPKTLPVYSTQTSISIDRQSAAMIDDKLFVLFNVGVKFYFYVYLLASKKFISLATDDRLNSSFEYVILNINNSVYYVDGATVLQYCFHLNRWITFSELKSNKVWMASDGKIMYQMFLKKSTQQVSSSEDLKIEYYDFKQGMLAELPDVPAVDQPSLVDVEGREKCDNLPISVNVIGKDFCVLFKRKTYFFHWKTQTWSSIDNLYEDFSTFTERDQNILFISAEHGVLLYSPVLKEWIADQKLNKFNSVSAIHMVM